MSSTQMWRRLEHWNVSIYICKAAQLPHTWHWYFNWFECDRPFRLNIIAVSCLISRELHVKLKMYVIPWFEYCYHVYCGHMDIAPVAGNRDGRHPTWGTALVHTGVIILDPQDMLYISLKYKPIFECDKILHSCFGKCWTASTIFKSPEYHLPTEYPARRIHI